MKESKKFFALYVFFIVLSAVSFGMMAYCVAVKDWPYVAWSAANSGGSMFVAVKFRGLRKEHERR